MTFDPSRVVQIWCNRNGSGYLVSDRLVLTAYHVVDGDGSAEVRRVGHEDQSWKSASVIWPNDRPPYESDELSDVALLLVEGNPWKSEGITPVRWGEIAGHDRIACVGVGFPEADATETRRESFAVRGDIDPLHTIRSGILTVHVNAGIVPRTTQRGSSWGGASGTALFCQDRLTAVTITDHMISDTANVLHAVPALHFSENPGFKSAVSRFGGEAGFALNSSAQTIRPIAASTPLSIVEVLACTVEWINAPLLPFPAKRRLREILDSALLEFDSSESAPYRRDSDIDGTLLVFPASSENNHSLSAHLIERFDEEIRNDWERTEYTRIRPQLRVFIHSGFTYRDSDGEYTGGIFDELHQHRQTESIQDALNGDPVGVICIASDAAYNSQANPLRNSPGKWINFTSIPDSGTPMKTWIRVSIPKPQDSATVKKSPHATCLLIASFASDEPFTPDHRDSAASHMKIILQEVSKYPPKGFPELDLRVESWGTHGVSVTATTEKSAIFLTGFLLPHMTKNLAIFNHRRPAAVRMNAGIHLTEEGAADTAITSARLAACAEKIRPGLREGEIITACLVSSRARSSDADNLADFIDSSRFIQVPENGMEGQIDAWLYVPYSPDMT
ncbi:serine protease [Streptomyces sp. NPDC058619]|uniref:S1 family peptidase n=1 Tax=unclassified Streptomyces TaxID=2593676 RepID=UPI003655BFAD